MGRSLTCENALSSWYLGKFKRWLPADALKIGEISKVLSVSFLLLFGITPLSQARADVRYVGWLSLQQYHSNVGAVPPSSMLTSVRFRALGRRLQGRVAGSPFFNLRSDNRGARVSGVGPWFRTNAQCNSRLILASDSPVSRTIGVCAREDRVCQDGSTGSRTYCGRMRRG